MDRPRVARSGKLRVGRSGAGHWTLVRYPASSDMANTLHTLRLVIRPFRRNDWRDLHQMQGGARQGVEESYCLSQEARAGRLPAWLVACDIHRVGWCIMCSIVPMPAHRIFADARHHAAFERILREALTRLPLELFARRATPAESNSLSGPITPSPFTSSPPPSSPSRPRQMPPAAGQAGGRWT
jgi:hypothetical protein